MNPTRAQRTETLVPCRHCGEYIFPSELRAHAEDMHPELLDYLQLIDAEAAEKEAAILGQMQ